MKNLFIRSAFMVMLLITVSISISAQNRGTGARGDAGQNQNARGGRGNSEEADAKRSAIQAQQKIAVERENKNFKDTMNRLQLERKSSTSDVERDLLKARTGAAQREHQAALQKIRAEAQAAMAALRH
jgi:hypothetical protein